MMRTWSPQHPCRTSITVGPARCAWSVDGNTHESNRGSGSVLWCSRERPAKRVDGEAGAERSRWWCVNVTGLPSRARGGTTCDVTQANCRSRIRLHVPGSEDAESPFSSTVTKKASVHWKKECVYWQIVQTLSCLQQTKQVEFKLNTTNHVISLNSAQNVL